MKINRYMLALAGLLLLASAALTIWANVWWLVLTAVIGLNLMIAGLTGICPAAIFLRKAGVSCGCGSTEGTCGLDKL